MTTALDWIEETKRHLLSGDRENLNRLAAAITTTSATTFTYEFTQGGIVEGAVVEIDLESIYIWSVNTASKVATVQRGYNGTVAATHLISSLIRVNPRFSHFSILQALNHELRDLSAPANGLFRVSVEETTLSAGVVGYDLSLDSSFIDAIELHVEVDTVAKFWKRLDNWRVMQNAQAADFTSGLALIIGEDPTFGTGVVRLTYKRTFGLLTAVTDDITTATGISTFAEDIPPLGAAVRLAFPRGIKRAFDESQGEPRRASEVEAAAMVQNASALLSFRNRRIGSEVTRLNALYPVRLAR